MKKPINRTLPPELRQSGPIFKSEPELAEQPLALEPGELFTRSMLDLREQFKSRNTNPSDPEWDGLGQIALAIEGMADGTLSAKFYLSSLAPGVGKTSAVCCSIRNLVTMDKYKDTGAIVFVFRCEEIERLKTDMGLSETDYAVLVSEKGEYAYMNKWGNQDRDKAKVLFTTQQRLQKECKEGTKFADISAFHFQGKARQVRVWDEAILPSLSLTATANQIARLFVGAAANNATVEAYLKTLCQLLEHMPEGIVVEPIIREQVDLEPFLSWYRHEEDRAVAEALWRFSGTGARVTKDGASGKTMLQYTELFPDDFAPLLILDASGLQRETYKLWIKGRGELHLLLSPQKDFTRLTIHHWDRGAGRSKNIPWGQIADGIANAISELPDEKILVVHFLKSGHVPNIEKMIRERTRNDPRLNFVTWGKHTATNDFKDCKHVILAGILQYATSAYEAIGRGAKGISVFSEFPDDEHKQTRLGEIKHNILQAACRGAVRQSDLNQCPEGCTLWVIYSTHKAVGTPRSLLADVFEHATVRDWQPLGEKPPIMRVGVSRAIDQLKRMTGTVTVPELANALGKKDQSNLNKIIPKGPFQFGLKQIGREFLPGHPGRFVEVKTRKGLKVTGP